MQNYERPRVIMSETMYEGVYLASGKVCDSIYMGGVWHKSDYSDWQNGTNIDGRGCEGCPANWDDGVCHAATLDENVDCRPSWETNGKGPDDKWNQ